MTKKKIQLSVHITDKELIWGIAYLLVSLFVLPSLLASLNQQLPIPLHNAWVNFLYFTLNFLFILWIFHGFFARSLAYAGQHMGMFLAAVILGALGYWLCSWGISLAIGKLFPDFTNLNDGSITSMVHENFWIMAIGTVLFVPATEEALHRGLIFGSLYQKSHTAAYILSTVIFAAVHILNYVGVYSPLHTALAFVQYIPAGVILAWVYRRSGSIFAPMLVHAMINGVSLFALK